MEPITNEPVNENKQNYIVAESQLQNFHITYFSEIQGVKANRQVNV